MYACLGATCHLHFWGNDRGLSHIQSSFLFHPQLDLIINLLGTPSAEDMCTACEGARAHIGRQTPKKPAHANLYSLSTIANHEAVHLLTRMLVFNPVSRTPLSALLSSGASNFLPCMHVFHFLSRMRLFTLFRHEAMFYLKHLQVFHFLSRMWLFTQFRHETMFYLKHLQVFNFVSRMQSAVFRREAVDFLIHLQVFSFVTCLSHFCLLFFQDPACLISVFLAHSTLFSPILLSCKVAPVMRVNQSAFITPPPMKFG